MRSHLLSLPLAGLIVVLGACGEPDPAGGAVPPPSPVSTTAPVGAEQPLAAVGGSLYEQGAAPVAELVGHDLTTFVDESEALGFGPVRVAWEDGEYLAVTDDLMPGRVNVAVRTEGERQIVVDAYVETDPESGSAEPEATIVDVFDGVEFYPACGNEILEFDGTTWHQVQEYEYPDVYDRAVNGLRENAPETVTVHGLLAPRVVDPGPGDDVGTLVVWSDGVAYFESDSGDLHAWLVDEELTYDWVC